MNVQKKKQDPYCFTCHGEKPKLACTTCVRSFHSGKCLGSKHTFDDEKQKEHKPKNWTCSICIGLEAAEDKPSDVKLLSVIMDRVATNKFYQVLKPTQKGGSVGSGKNSAEIVNPIDVTIIKNNIGAYTSFAEFRADILWIQHNCMVLNKGEHASTKAVRDLLDYVDTEIDSVKKCAECYYKANKFPKLWFSMVCSEPHLLVWAKMAGCPGYWPGKLMSIDGQMVHVRFFGDHTHANIPATNCFLFSKGNPGRLSTALYNTAIKEANLYIENIRQKFGSFEMAKNRTLFDPALHERYLNDMIPGLVENRANNSKNSEDSFEDALSDDSIMTDDTDDCDEQNKNSNRDEPVSKNQHSIAPCSVPLDILGPETCGKLRSTAAKRRQTKRSNTDEPNEKMVRTNDKVGEKSTDNNDKKVVEREIKPEIENDQKPDHTENDDQNTEQVESNVRSVMKNDQEDVEQLKPDKTSDDNAETCTNSATTSANDVVQINANVRSNDGNDVDDLPLKQVTENLEKLKSEQFELKQQLEETNQQLAEAKEDFEKIIAEHGQFKELKGTFDNLQQKFIESQDANSKLIETIASLKSDNVKNCCSACGKCQDLVFYCNEICRRTHVHQLIEEEKLKTEAAMNITAEDEDHSVQTPSA